MKERFKNKIALVTGGGTGIGQAIAKNLADEGAFVLIVGRREKPLIDTSAYNKNISYVAADITDSESIKKIVKTIEERFNGQLDILVNNAGWCPVQPITEITVDDYDQAFNLDVRALVDMTVQTLPLLIRVC